MDALINQQRIGRARDETYYYFDHHPRGRFAEHLFIMTGVLPGLECLVTALVLLERRARLALMLQPRAPQGTIRA